MIPRHASAKLEDLVIDPPEHYNPPTVWTWITIPVYYYWPLATGK